MFVQVRKGEERNERGKKRWKGEKCLGAMGGRKDMKEEIQGGEMRRGGER